MTLADVGLQLFQTLACRRADDVDRGADRDARDGIQRGGDVVAEIGFGQEHDGRGAVLVGHRQVALQSTWIQVLVEGCDEEHGVDVGGQDLLIRSVTRDLARELGPAW